MVVMEEDRVRKLADIKTKLERRLEELEEEISLIRELLEVIDSILGSISFKPASELVKPEVVEKIREGVLNPEAVLEYEIIEEEGFLTKVLVRNCRDERRIRDIRGAFRWTLERMLDRERSS